jgi:hypothetical protein
MKLFIKELGTINEGGVEDEKPSSNNGWESDEDEVWEDDPEPGQSVEDEVEIPGDPLNGINYKVFTLRHETAKIRPSFLNF